MKFKSLLTELLYGGDVYHYTGAQSIEQILKTNKINLSSALGTTADNKNKKHFFLSLSRTKSLKFGYSGDKSGAMCRIVLDGDKLNYNNKTVPVDYWGDFGGDKTKSKRFEYEERVISNKPTIDNAIKYIVRIEIIIPKNKIDEKSSYIGNIKEVILLGKKLNIPVIVYENSKDFDHHENIMNDYILSINDTEEPWRMGMYGIKGIYTKMLVLILYDNSKLNDDNFCEYINEYIKKNHINQDIDCDKVIQYMWNLRSDYRAQDFWASMSADLHTYFKDGSGGDLRKDILLLTREMKKYNVRTIPQLIQVKVNGIKAPGDKKNWSSVYSIYRLEYNYETEKYDIWDKKDNNSPLTDLNSIYFNTWKYRGQLSDDDFDVMYKMKSNNNTIGDWINYLMNKYTIEKSKEIIWLSGYDKYGEKYEWKLDKK